MAWCHRTMLAYWKFESISLQRRVLCELGSRLAVTHRPAQAASHHRPRRSDRAGSSVRLGYLAPDITEAILDGRQPRDLTADKLLAHSRLPLGWHEQRTALGIA